jgi:HD-like signal output (HDOD) protein
MEPSKINFKNIPVQAGIISNIIKLEVDSNNCFQELDDLVSSDQGVASLVLRVVNSPFYSRGNKVTTIPFAISLLGYNVVRSLALLAFTRSLFSHTKNEEFRVHIWQHSLLTAIASQNISQEFGKVSLSDEAFIAGLMHDTGKVLMYSHNPAMYQDVLKYAFENNCTSVQAEHHYFGFDHCQVGAEAVKEWKLPERFRDYMGTDLSLPPAEHHADQVMTCLLVANFLIKAAGIGGLEIDDYEIKKSALSNFGLHDVLHENLLHPDFIPALMENDTYKLCARI